MERRGSKQHRDTKEAIDSAVKSVNQVLSKNSVLGSNAKNAGGKESAIDESLDSLDFFKVTNLGRMGNKALFSNDPKLVNQTGQKWVTSQQQQQQ